MGTTNKETLKGYFKAGSIPKESNFADLIDSVLLMDGTGKVGIGTPTPSGQLNISELTGTVHGVNQGTLIIDHENIGGASSIVFRSKGNRGSDYGFIQYQDTSTVGGAGESALLSIGIMNDADDHIALMPSGSVGIGITAPTQKLDVQGGNARVNNTFIGDVGFGPTWGGISHAQQGSTTGYALISSTDGKFTLINKNNTGDGYIGFRVGNADRMIIQNDGNVGIGTNGPTQRLEVAGNAKITGNIEAANSDIYFSNTGHNHTGIGNQPGWAAIENSKDFNCLMILGRSTGSSAANPIRVVKVWDQLWVSNQQVSASDLRDKTNVEPLQHGLNAIKELRPVKYNWLNNKDGQKSLGLIAQEVLPVISEAVHYDESKPDEPGWGISYQSLIPVLINAVKELDLKIESIQKKRAEA